jgi:DNA-binding transcriptional LysR family regulator
MGDDPNLPEIAAFLAVVERGSFSAAARTLEVTKSSVSRRISALEHKLGARLLQRTSRRLMLTEVGVAYHTRVAAAMGSLRDAAELVHGLQVEPRGHLRITAPVDLSRLLARLVVGFSARHPSVTVEVVLTQRVVDLVGEGIDVALRAGELRDSSLVGRRVAEATTIIAASPQYLEKHGTPGSVAELAEHRFVLFRPAQSRPGCNRVVLQGPAGEQTVEVAGTISSDDFAFVGCAVMQGAGLGIVPPLSLLDELDSGTLVRVLPQWQGRSSPLHLIYPSRELVPAKVRAFREFATQWLAAVVPGCVAHVLAPKARRERRTVPT